MSALLAVTYFQSVAPVPEQHLHLEGNIHVSVATEPPDLHEAGIAQPA